MDVAVAEMLALGPVDPAMGAATAGVATASRPPGVDRSPVSLAVLLVRAAERVRTDPEANFAHCAVWGAAEVLCGRLGERMAVAAGAARDATEGP
jgi:hypothetical protein